MRCRIKMGIAGWRPDSDFDSKLRETIRSIAPRFTMVAVDRLRSLATHAKRVHASSIPGCIVECGTWRGGSLALIDWTLRELGEARELWACDSFEGLPRPGNEDPKSAHSWFFEGWCAATEADVRDALTATGGTVDRLNSMRGWLEDTLPNFDAGPIALLNVDVDWYDSVKTVLDNLWEHVSPGGVISFDDYGRWSGCDKAVHEFLDTHGFSRDLLTLSGKHGAWMQKP